MGIGKTALGDWPDRLDECDDCLIRGYFGDNVSPTIPSKICAGKTRPGIAFIAS
jgi:hypothetical protein